MGRERSAPALLSVVLPVRNGGQALNEQLEALAGQDYAGPFEVLVADNGSTDETPERVRSFAGRLPGLRLVDASGRTGPNHARNVGAQAARGDLLAYCDADDVAAPGWLKGLAEASARYDLVGGRIDHETLNDERSRAWRGTGASERLPVLLGFLPYALGANLAVWAEVLRDVGGWQEGLGAAGDDVELCWRAQLRGYTLGFAKDAVMRYRHRSGLRSMATQLYRYGLAEPRLYRQYLGAGVPRQTVRRAVANWADLCLGVWNLLRPEPWRGLWVRQAAFRWGRLQGSLQHRVWCL